METLDIYVDIRHSNSGSLKTISLTFRPMITGYFDDYAPSVGGVGINPLSPDVPNEIFASEQDAIDYYYPDKSAAIISAMISQTGRDFVLGVKKYLPPDVQSAVDLKQNLITAGAHITDGATNAPTDAATNAPTNLNVITTLLGGLTGEVNATNTRQNALATKYNDAAAKLNALAAKVNLLFDHLEAQGLQLAA